jgi:DNA-binding LacI/PurR family transcriptional regulator
MSPSRLKMSDIARMAEVSVSTVSRALAGSPLVPEPVRKKVEEIAQTHGYVVNHAARNLRLQTTRTVGLVLPMGHETGQQITDPFLLEMIGYLSEEVIRRGYDILLTKVAAPTEGWLNGLIQSHRFDGMLMLGQSDQHAVINDVAPRYLPMVVWGEKLASQSYCSVGVDNVFAGRLATQHLLGLGRQTVRFMGPAHVPEVDSRYQGYLEAMQATPRNGANTDLIDTHFTFESALETTRALIRSRTKVDALFAASDVIAHGAMTAFAEAGLNIPKDVAICGFDDVAMSKSLAPPLTTIKQDLAMASKLMVDLLFKRIGGDITSSAVIPASLIVRASTVG